MAYPPKLCNVRVLRKLLQSMILVKKISVQAETKVDKSIHKPKHKANSWVSPPLKALRIEKIKTVTGIDISLSCISWAKMSVPDFHVLDWNLKTFPPDFLNCESSALALAYKVKDSLPDSDIYVVESLPFRKACARISQIQLISMLTVLLNGVKKDSNWEEKVIFQKEFVMNNLYNIHISNERVSTRSLVESILLESTYLANCDSTDDSYSIYPSISVDCEHVEKFRQFNLEKQETLSIALLLTLSFIDINLLRNSKSLDKILAKKKYNFKN